MPNKTILSVPLAGEILNQFILITQLRVPATNKSMLLAALANKVPNQPPFAMQSKILALFQQDLTRVQRILLVPVLLESLIIKMRYKENYKKEVMVVYNILENKNKKMLIEIMLVEVN